MNTDDALKALARVPKPRLDPFLSRRIAAEITQREPAPPSRARALLWSYWIAVAFLIGLLLGSGWSAVIMLIALGSVAAFPDAVIRALSRVPRRLLRRHGRQR